jgi:hypothetical protein
VSSAGNQRQNNNTLPPHLQNPEEITFKYGSLKTVRRLSKVGLEFLKHCVF